MLYALNSSSSGVVLVWPFLPILSVFGYLGHFWLFVASLPIFGCFWPVLSVFGNFGHFGLKLGPIQFINLTQNPWDYKTRAQELTSGAIRMLLSFCVKIWELLKDGRVWGLFYKMNLVVNFNIFYNFWYISTLDGQIWMKLVTKLKSFWYSRWIW